MFKRILVPVDGSEQAMAALELAVKLQASGGGELLILTVFRHHSLLETSLSMVRPEEPETMDYVLRDHAKGVAEGAKARAEALGSAGPRAFVKKGPPARTIVAFGEEKGADLIVLGSRGLGDLEGYLLGSVSHKVTSLADCPVLVV